MAARTLHGRRELRSRGPAEAGSAASRRDRGAGLKYPLILLALAAAFVAQSWAAWDDSGWPAVFLLYPALSLTLLAAAYAGPGPGLLLKRPSGRRSPLGWLLFGPYLLLGEASLASYRLLSREPAFTRAGPSLFFGRRLSAREGAAAGWAAVLDLAAELGAASPRPAAPRYRSLPVLDGAAPAEAELRSAVAWVRSQSGGGPVYVHSALGHGRSACIVVACLLSDGAVRTAAEGAALLRSLRPGVRLSAAQFRALRRLERPADETCPK